MTEQLLEEFEESIDELTLIPSGGGVFEVDVDGERIYSKKATGHHAEYEDVARLIRSISPSR
jgi:selenoprotein W-related protein